MQIGFCSLQTAFTSHRGVGDDKTSYAFDGYRIKKWNDNNLAYGAAWTIGDVIGSLIDFEAKTITFYRNSKSLGVAFTNLKVGENHVYFPSISM